MECWLCVTVKKTNKLYLNYKKLSVESNQTFTLVLILQRV